MSSMSPAEVYWMLLSFLALEKKVQLDYLPSDIPRRGDLACGSPVMNPLVALNLALYWYSNYWYDDFFPAINHFDELQEVMREKFVGSDVFCYEEFMGGGQWEEIRVLARAVLDESGLGFCPVDRPIRFDDLVELVDM